MHNSSRNTERFFVTDKAMFLRWATSQSDSTLSRGSSSERKVSAALKAEESISSFLPADPPTKVFASADEAVAFEFTIPIC
jgi:hypothetical protein